jgi:hypothetical protein
MYDMCKGMRNKLQEMYQVKWHPDMIGFGMGGALLQRIDRDTCKWAQKCSEIIVEIIDGENETDVISLSVTKDPITDQGKRSKTGRIELLSREHETGYKEYTFGAKRDDGTYHRISHKNPGEPEVDVSKDDFKVAFEDAYVCPASDKQRPKEITKKDFAKIRKNSNALNKFSDRHPTFRSNKDNASIQDIYTYEIKRIREIKALKATASTSVVPITEGAVHTAEGAVPTAEGAVYTDE